MIDLRGYDALDALADIMEPVTEIAADKEFEQRMKQGTKLNAVQYAIKNHKKSVVEILSILNGEAPETYLNKVTLFTLPKELLAILNSEEVASLFTSLGQNEGATSSGSATENTEDGEK